MEGELRLPRMKKNRPVPRGLEAGLESWAGVYQRWKARRSQLGTEADLILAEVEAKSHLSKRELAQFVAKSRTGWQERRGDRLSAQRAALTAVALVARYELRLTPHREQLMGTLGLERGWLVEMATGEGKTLTLAMAAVLTAWRGHPCHVLTANDYLAGRDAKLLSGFYRWCGVSVESVTGEISPMDRKACYAAQVVYTTSRELVGDFLRDRLRLGGRVSAESWRPWARRSGGRGPEVLLPQLHTVYVDEADQVLVDDAVTPLIISAPQENRFLAELCEEALREARNLREGEDYSLDRKNRRVRLDARVTKLEETEGVHPLLRVARWREEWLSKALSALRLYESGRHYFVRDGKVVLLDEATGRPMADRTLGEGMHSLLEVKEGVAISTPTGTLASLSFQRFFRQIPSLAGVTGTARDAAGEFWRLYRLPVLVVPTHRPVRRTTIGLRGFTNEDAKWDYLVEMAGVWKRNGQPVLIGTRTVTASEAVASRLNAAGIRFALLNGVRDEDEAQIIAAAGQAGQITIATNMAGRGTDIVPTDPALAAGGLRVIATERHRSSRVDRQLHGRSGRQGQPGVVEPLGSWEDEIVEHYLPGWWRRLGQRMLGNGCWLGWSLRFAQWRAGRHDAERRLSVLKHDQWLDEHLSLGASRSSKQGA